MVTSPTCPRCHSDEVIPIVYGMPTEETLKESRAGRVALGSRVAGPESPRWRCVACSFEWRDEAPPSLTQ